MEKAEIRALVEGIDGWLPDFEGELLYDLARGCKGRGAIVEIGSWKGKSTIWLAKGSKAGNGVKVYAVDPHTGSSEHRQDAGRVWTFDEFKRNMRAAGVEDLVVPILKESVEAAQAVSEPVELIFIDGAHEYELVKLDFLAWFPKVLDGGVMAFHDTIGWEGPKRVVKELVYKSESFRRVGLVGSITFAEKTRCASLTDRLRSRYVLGLKHAWEVGRKAPVPAGLRKLGHRVLAAIH